MLAIYKLDSLVSIKPMVEGENSDLHIHTMVYMHAYTNAHMGTYILLQIFLKGSFSSRPFAVDLGLII